MGGHGPASNIKRLGEREMREREILVLQHVEAEGPGLIGTVAREEGFTLRVIRLFRGERVPCDARCFGALVVMGGPMGVYDEEEFPFIPGELRLLRSAFGAGVPVLGVCLGAQLMARAAGARVWSGAKKEIGFYRISLTQEGMEDRLLLGLPAEFTVFQWHGDTFEIPTGGRNLASSPLFEHQLVKIGTNSYGLQFHIEVTESMVREFLEAGSDELEGAPYIKAPEQIIEDARVLLPGIHCHGRAIIKRFFRNMG